MSLLVAIQSAIFYYVACTPCNEAKARFKAKQKAKKDREEKMRIQMEQPGLYHHPSPFNTNPYWQEEIKMGPSLPKKSGSKNTSQRKLHSAGTGRNSTSASLTCTNSSNPANSPTSATDATSPTMTATDPPTRLSDDEGWNKKRYQREDEELWGHELSKMGHKLVDNIVKAGSSAGRMIKGELGKEKPVTEEDRSSFYQTPRNPPVNDYHPPIVGSAPANKNALRWMLQPPPPAKLMEGRVPVSRAQSFGSTASRASKASRTSRYGHAAADEPPLGRLVREKAMQQKIRQKQEPDSPSESELIESLIGTRPRKTTHSSRGRSIRSRSLSPESVGRHSEASTDGEPGLSFRPRAGHRPVYHISDDTSDDGGFGDEYPVHRPSWNGGSHGRTAQRPKLGTIRSDSGSATRAGSRRGRNGSNTGAPDDATPRTPSPTALPASSSKTPRVDGIKPTVDHAISETRPLAS